jgi:predicted thioesterase
VEVTASATYVDGRLHRFTVGARHIGGNGKVIGSGEITRVVVDAEKFLSRL